MSAELTSYFAKRGVKVGVPTNHDTDPDVARAATEYQATVAEFFAKQGPAIARQTIKAYSALAKAMSEDEANKKAQDILSALDFNGWTVLVNGTNQTLGELAKKAGKQALANLEITQTDITDQVDELAVEFARERSAELVGMKWVDGELVENPDARWAITDGTREMLRSDITTAIKEGWANKKLADTIEGNYAFSESRAETIARTETARAHVKGNMAGWKGSGVVSGKQWLLGSEHGDQDEDECDSAAEMGVIPLDDDFGEAGSEPPAHPRCVCALVPVLSDDDEGQDAEET